MTRNNPNGFKSVLVTGGGGYVGSALVPRLLDEGYHVKAVDLFWFGQDIFGEHRKHPALTLIDLDIRNGPELAQHLKGVDAVIHLACISNDPSFELDLTLGKSINFDCFPALVQGAVDGGVKRFIYASSSSIYGVKEEPDVTEDAVPEPLTDYSKYKLACERLLREHDARGMERVTIRPATVCGYAPRLRLDLVVNILTTHALVNRKIRIFGGKQLRPNICIHDMVRAYLTLLEAPRALVDNEAFNAGYHNHSVEQLAHLVRDALGDPSIVLEQVPTDDNRSYHINSDKIRRTLGFTAQHTIQDAVRDLADAFRGGKVRDPLTNPIYYNIKTMQRLKVS
ncbi:MAG: SDR family oxidoreductase [Gemmataceae bacterium]|nr:SDR family oxidoreductase [Gemmataceae bacterium]